jgi:hypothetical protein
MAEQLEQSEDWRAINEALDRLAQRLARAEEERDRARDYIASLHGARSYEQLDSVLTEVARIVVGRIKTAFRHGDPVETTLNAEWVVAGIESWNLLPPAAPPEGEKPRTAFAWLIERGHSEGHVPTVWLDVNDGPYDGSYGQWVTDANSATKFDKAGAEMYIRKNFVPNCRAVEHGWFAALDAQEGKP